MTHPTPAAPSKSLLRLAPYLVATLAMLPAGCSTWKSPGSWFGGESTGVTEPTAQATEVSAYYTSVEGVKLYPEPRYSSSFIVALPLHQKVYRSKVERGFAYVEVDGSGQKGWLDNGKLVWRLPEAEKSAPPPAAPEGSAEAPAAETKPEPAPADEGTAEPPMAPGKGSILGPAPAEAQEGPPEESQPDESQDVDPSIFSPF